MNRCPSFVAAVFAVGGLVATLSAGEPQKMTALVQGNNAFGLDLYGQLRRPPGNLFLSPHSIATALAMACGGARGDTAAQMARALHCTLAEDELGPAYAALDGELNAGGKTDYQLSIANRLWGQKRFPFLDSYRELTARCFGAPVEELDFQQPEAARSTINRWVEEQTHEKIKDLLPAGSISGDTRLVLTNAIYFLGNWQKQFEEKATRDAAFYPAAGKETQVPMMYQQSHFRLGAADGLQLLELPYKGERLSMLVLLPDQRDGLPKLEASLSAGKLEGWLKTLVRREVRVSLPKFKLSSQFILNDPLSALGMTLPFGDKADFSGMDGRRDLYISVVVHKAFVDVNERGTEAAAATGIAMKAMAMGPPPAQFRADHPFLFLIRDEPSGSILFFGRMAEPQA